MISYQSALRSINQLKSVDMTHSWRCEITFKEDIVKWMLWLLKLVNRFFSQISDVSLVSLVSLVSRGQITFNYWQVFTLLRGESWLSWPALSSWAVSQDIRAVLPVSMTRGYIKIHSTWILSKQIYNCKSLVFLHLTDSTEAEKVNLKVRLFMLNIDSCSHLQRPVSAIEKFECLILILFRIKKQFRSRRFSSRNSLMSSSTTTIIRMTLAVFYFDPHSKQWELN